jgi:cation transport regulator ChaC
MSSTPTTSSIAETWTLEAQAQIIATATGGRGPNDEYLYNTARTSRNWVWRMRILTGWPRGCGR